MKRSNRLVILVGVMLAVLAFVAIVILLNGQAADEPVAEELRESVLVATEDIDIGEEITPAKVEVNEIDPEAVQGTALSDPSQVSGQPALFAIPAGSQVSGEAIGLGADPTTNIAALLQPGEKAITFQVDRVTGADFLVKAGDSIDVVVSAEINVLQETADSAASTDDTAPPRFEAIPGLEAARSVKAILQDKRVIYVSANRAQQPEPVDSDGDGTPDAEQPAQPVIDSVIIIFAGTARDAEAIKFAQSNVTETGSLMAIVRHADDDVVEETLGVTIDQLVETYGLRIPNIVEQLNEEAEEQ